MQIIPNFDIISMTVILFITHVTITIGQTSCIFWYYHEGTVDYTKLAMEY